MCTDRIFETVQTWAVLPEIFQVKRKSGTDYVVSLVYKAVLISGSQVSIRAAVWSPSFQSNAPSIIRLCLVPNHLLLDVACRLLEIIGMICEMRNSQRHFKVRSAYTLLL